MNDMAPSGTFLMSLSKHWYIISRRMILIAKTSKTHPKRRLNWRIWRIER
jgi:hypothetical protein